jgi:tetratricopeptide (TPR) repeat protein
MIFLPEPILRQRGEIARQLKTGELTETAAGERLLEISPDDSAPYVIKAQQLMQGGDADGAERWFWKALERRPCDYTCYSILSMIRRDRDKDDVLAKCFQCLELWKLALASTISREAAARFGPLFEKTSGDSKDPGSYEDLAAAFETTLDPEALPADAGERLLPYRLLNDMQVQARDDIDAGLLQEILANSARVIPVWRAALREWGNFEDALSPRACAVIAATLGEMAGPEVLDDLLELGAFDDVEISLHAQWAIWRLGQKYPAETLEHFRAATPSASCVRRCNLADQMDLLPDTPGREDALADLLQGFAGFADQPDAAYLLMTVAYALDESGQDERARELLAQNEAALPKRGRKTLRELKETEDGFVPFLTAHGIDELDIEGVCLERYLMDEDEEDEEEEESPPPRFKPGRNDPCWCGSGKKYKKCHLAADEEAERRAAEPELEDAGTEPPAGTPLHAKVLGDLIAFSAERYTLRNLKEARRLYFGPSAGNVDEDELAESGFFDWFARDFRPRGKGPALVEEYLRSRGTGLPAAERELLQSLSAARYGLYEVERVEEGAGVELKDVLGGEPFFVHDVSSSRELVQWDAILNRVEDSEGRWVFSGNGILVPRSFLSDFVSMVEKDSREAGQTPAEYLRINSHRWYREVKELSRRRMRDLKLVTAEGDAVEFCSATYSVRDEEAAAAALASAEVFEETTSDTPGVRHFGWLETVREGPRRSYGHIEIAGGQLRLETTSRRRLEIGRQLLEKHAGSWLEHQRDAFESAAEALEKQRRQGPAPPAPESGIPPEIARELILRMKTEHYAKWLDEPLPALEGKTPRQAVRSASGRRAVDDLLRIMENGEARASREGGGAFDFATVRRALGLETKEE